jgi:FecR-like protein
LDRRRVRVFATAIALGAVLLLAFGVFAVVGQTKALGASTTLTVLSGDVSVRHGAGEFVAASDGLVLGEGDAIRTGADGRAVLTYFEGSTVTIEPVTELEIDTAAAAPDGSTVVLMTQVFGRTWHVVTKLVTAGSRYEVKTPASTASVRGTEFVVDVDADATTVTTTEGEVAAEVADPAQVGHTVTVPVTAGNTHHQKRNASVAPAQTAPKPERTVSVTVGATNSLIIDPVGRANGVTKDGKLVAQTPGARVRRDGDTVVVDLPDLPDGTITTTVDKDQNGDDVTASVTARITEADQRVDLRDAAQYRADGRGASGFVFSTGTAGPTGRVLTTQEKAALPSAKITKSGHAVPRD